MRGVVGFGSHILFSSRADGSNKFGVMWTNVYMNNMAFLDEIMDGFFEIETILTYSGKVDFYDF